MNNPLRFLIPLLLILVSCTRTPREIEHPLAVKPPDSWSTSASADAVVREWWQSFSDDTLAELVTEAIDHNYDLRAAAARLEVASAQARIVGAEALPSVEAGLSGNRQRQNFIGFPIPGAENQVLSRTFSNFGVSLAVSWELDLWGRIGAAKAAGVADFQAVEADLRAARLSVAAQTAKAWFALLEAERQRRLAEQARDSFERTAERIRDRYQVGLRSPLDLRLALSSVAGAQALLEQRLEQYDRASRQLEILLGRYPSASLMASPGLPILGDSPPAGLPSELVSRRPDLEAARRRLAAADYRWIEARTSLYPRFSLTTSGGTATNDLSELLLGSRFVWRLAGNLVQPIFQGGRLRAEVDASAGRSREALANFATQVLRAFAEVESALAAEAFLRNREHALEEAVAQSTASLRLANDRYTSGLEPIVTVLEAQRRSLDSEAALITVRRLKLATRVDLHLALGGGFEAESPTGEKEP